MRAQNPVARGARGVINAARAPLSIGRERFGRARILPLYGEENRSNVLGLPQREFVDPLALYQVAASELSWVSANGVEMSALVFYPISPPANGQKFGAVIYSHGLGASAESFAYLGYSWAGRGVATICLRHPETDESIWRGKIRAMSELREAYNKYWTARDRATAIRSCIDFLYARHDSDGPLGRDLDLGRIGVAGNDLGALGALLVAGQLPPDNGTSLKDPRVAAVLALSPPVFCDSDKGTLVYGEIRSPAMVVMGTQDNGIVGTTRAEQRRLPYDSIDETDRYLLVLEGGDHRVYGGRRTNVRRGDVQYQETIAKETCDFWVAYLLNDLEIRKKLSSQGSTVSFSNARVERRLGLQIAND
ncbi:MAG: hypothetical protein IJM30_05625 [Thermoguttaceae bacterium]|nr:hypothetical protein [Thermoguttaceae bacterium]